MNSNIIKIGLYNHLCIDVKTEDKFLKPICIEQLFMYDICVLTCVVNCSEYHMFQPDVVTLALS